MNIGETDWDYLYVILQIGIICMLYYRLGLSVCYITDWDYLYVILQIGIICMLYYRLGLSVCYITESRVRLIL